MRKTVFIGALLALICMFCRTGYALTADDWVAQGDAFLEAHDTAGAYNAYLNAYNLDNSHPGANFGLAVTTLPYKIVDGGDTDIADFLAQNNISLIGTVYDLVVESTGDIQSTIPQIQDFVSGSVQPHIDRIINYLDLLKADPSFTKVFTGAMYGGEQDIRLDHSSVLAAGSVMHLAKGLLNILCAYDLDFNPGEMESDCPVNIFNENENLLTIRESGMAKFNTALASFQAVADNLIAGYDFIDGKVDPAEDDMFVFPAEDEWFNYLRSDIRGLLVDLRGMLTPGGREMDLTELALKVSFYSETLPLFRFPQTIDLSRLFTHPLTRANLEPVEFDQDGPVLASLWDFDQTFNGVFPDMTRPEFVGLFQEETWFKTPAIFAGDIIIEGRVCPEASQVKVYRDSTPYVNESSQLIYLASPSWDGWFQSTDTTALNDTYYYRIYTYYPDGSFQMSTARRAARELYVNAAAAGVWKGTRDEPYRHIGPSARYAIPGSTVYVAGGTYYLSDDVKNTDLIYIDEPDLRFVGSCSPHTWMPDLGSTPTIIDAAGELAGFLITEWAHNTSIENFVIRNAAGWGVGMGSSGNTIKNCVIYNCGFDWEWGGRAINPWNWSPDNRVINCTIAGNYRGIEGARLDTVKNTIIADNHLQGVNLGDVDEFSFNNVWGNSPNYGGIPDMTGINGNISQDSLFVDPASGNYRLASGSPCIGAGEDGVDMGAYRYMEIQAGDISGDGVINISDVILCLRMSVKLPVTIDGMEYMAPYHEWLLDRADMNLDGVVNISDVILILRRAIGLDP